MGFNVQPTGALARSGKANPLASKSGWKRWTARPSTGVRNQIREVNVRKVLLKPALFASSLAALVMVGGLPSFDSSAAPESAAAAEGGHPGIAPILPDTPLTESGVYPPEVRVGGFDGAYKLATVFKSAAYPGNKVAFWESEPGVLKAVNYPMDEFIYVLEGHLVTTDADGTQREFHAGDTFVLPKAWVGTWDMKTHFKKLLVNF
jgi:uncharacterized cupin superfamily protein